MHLKLSGLLLLSLAVTTATAAELPTPDQLSEVANNTISAQEKVKPLPDFSSIKDRNIRKQAFINTLLREARPILYTISKRRTVLLGLYLRYRNGDPLTSHEQQWVLWLAHHMKVNSFDSDHHKSWITLIKRTDTIPLSLLVAQGAIESAWGTSRFAREGNNYFGIWCSRPGCGMVPKRRPAGAVHEVERYSSLSAAINKYIHILNTRPAFQELRNLRHQQRGSLLSPSGTLLAKGLKQYAENGDQYLNTLEKVIRQNQLGLFD